MKTKMIQQKIFLVSALFLACFASLFGQKYTNGTRLLKGAEVLSATPLQLDYVLEKLADTAKITVNLHEGKTHLVLDDGSGKWREWWYYMGKWQVKTAEGNGGGSQTETDPVWTLDKGNYYTKANLQINGQSQIHWNNITNAPTIPAPFELHPATTGTIGGMMAGDGLNVDNNGKVNIKKATTYSLGGVTVGSGLNVDYTGKISLGSHAHSFITNSADEWDATLTGYYYVHARNGFVGITADEDINTIDDNQNHLSLTPTRFDVQISTGHNSLRTIMTKNEITLARNIMFPDNTGDPITQTLIIPTSVFMQSEEPALETKNHGETVFAIWVDKDNTVNNTAKIYLVIKTGTTQKKIELQ